MVKRHASTISGANGDALCAKPAVLTTLVMEADMASPGAHEGTGLAIRRTDGMRRSLLCSIAIGEGGDNLPTCTLILMELPAACAPG